MRTKLRSKFTLFFIVCAALLAVGGTAMALVADPSGNTSGSTSGTTAAAPTIASDKADYAPGELVTLTGSGWVPGESVHIVVNDTYGATWKHDVYVDADASGNITDQFNLPDSFVSDYDVTATGSSGTATTSFTDGNVTYSPTRLPATGLQAVTAGNSVNLAPDVTLTKTGGGADPVVNTPITVTNKTTGSLTGQTCGGAGTAIPSSWLSVASPTLPQTITTSQNVTFRVSPPANARAGTYTGAVELANSTTNNTNAVDVCLNVSAAPTAVNTTTTASSTTATYGNSSATLNANVSPASGPAVGSGTVTFTVKKGATTIGTVTSGTVSAGSASANFPLSGVNADTYTIEAAYNAGSGFNGSNNSTQTPAAELTVIKAAGSVTINNIPANATFGGSFTPAYTKAGDGATSVVSNTPAVCSVSGGDVNFDAAGTCKLQAKVAEGTNHLAATGAEQSFTIAKAAGSVTINNIPANATFGGSFTPAYTKAGDGATSVVSNTPAVCSVSGGDVNFDAAGTCKLQAKVAEGTNHLAATGAEQSFTIAKAAGSVTINNIPANATFGGSFTPAYTKAGDGATSVVSNTPAVCSVSGGDVNFDAA